MLKTTLAAALVVATLAGASAPAFANTESVFGSGDAQDKAQNAQFITHDLRKNGVDVLSVSEWGNYIQATVRAEDGSLSFQYYEPLTLKQVTLR